MLKRSLKKRILVILPQWLGDMIMAHTLVRLLKQRHPDIPIDVVAAPWAEPLVARMPEVTQGYRLPIVHGSLGLRTRWRLAQVLRRQDYSQGIVLPNSYKSALLLLLAGIPHRTGWRGEMRFFLLNDIRLLNVRCYPQMVQRYAALAFPPGALLPTTLPLPHLVSNTHQRKQALADFAIDSAVHSLIAIAPGAAFGDSKRWPAAHFAAVVDQAIGTGHTVLCLGSAQERSLGQQIRERLQNTTGFYDLCGRTNLAQALDLLAACRTLICNDSGLMHLASAAGTPPIALFGSTTPRHTPPLHPDAVIQQLDDLPCRPCFQRVCPLKHHQCLRGLHPDAVIPSLRRFG